MGPRVPDPVPAAKGTVCYCLDEFSKGAGARARVEALRKALAGIAPSYAGLTDVFDQHLVSKVIRSAHARQAIRDHLQAYWFDPKSKVGYFPGVPVARIYGEGLAKALDLALKGGGKSGVVPLHAWWVLDSTTFRVMSLTDVKGGKTVGGNVTFLIHTPRPRVKGRAAKAVPPYILGNVAESHFTGHTGSRVTSRRVRDMT